MDVGMKSPCDCPYRSDISELFQPGLRLEDIAVVHNGDQEEIGSVPTTDLLPRWINDHVISIEKTPTRTCYPAMSAMVKEQFLIDRYAKIDHSQKLIADRKCHYLITNFTRSNYKGAQIVPTEIIDLCCTFYPLFFWNDDYISLQAQSNDEHGTNPMGPDTFIVSKKSCFASGFLRSFMNQNKHKTIVCIEHVPCDILELVVKYLSNMYHNTTPHSMNNQMKLGIYRLLLGGWDVEFINVINAQTVQRVLSAAEHMQCRSLVSLARAQTALLRAIHIGQTCLCNDETRILNEFY